MSSNDQSSSSIFALSVGLMLSLLLLPSHKEAMSFYFYYHFIFFSLLTYWIWNKQKQNFNSIYHIDLHRITPIASQQYAGFDVILEKFTEKRDQFLKGFIAEKGKIRFLIYTMLIVASYRTIPIFIKKSILDLSIESSFGIIFVFIIWTIRIWGGFLSLLMLAFVSYPLFKGVDHPYYYPVTFAFIILFIFNLYFLSHWYWQNLINQYFSFGWTRVAKRILPQIIIFISLFILTDAIISPKNHFLEILSKSLNKMMTSDQMQNDQKQIAKIEKIDNDQTLNSDVIEQEVLQNFVNFAPKIKNLKLNPNIKLERSIIDKEEKLKEIEMTISKLSKEKVIDIQKMKKLMTQYEQTCQELEFEIQTLEEIKAIEQNLLQSDLNNTDKNKLENKKVNLINELKNAHQSQLSDLPKLKNNPQMFKKAHDIIDQHQNQSLTIKELNQQLELFNKSQDIVAKSEALKKSQEITENLTQLNPNDKNIEKLKNELKQTKVIPPKKANDYTKKIYALFFLLIGFMIFHLLQKFLQKKKIIVEPDITPALKHEILSDLKLVQMSDKDFLAEVKRKYTFYYETIRKIYFKEDYAPPALSIPKALPSNSILARYALSLGETFNLIEFAGRNEFSPKEKTLFRSEFEQFTQKLKTVLSQ